MGLDITAYGKLTPALDVALDEDGRPVDYDAFWRPGSSMEWSEVIWPGRGEGLEAKVIYAIGRKYGFAAGSYPNYGWWRDKLARLAGYPSARAVHVNPQSGPFVELIHFADNEGVIGPVVSAKLARDFAAYAERAITFSATIPDVGERRYFLERYGMWSRAFEMAADGGAVVFH